MSNTAPAFRAIQTRLEQDAIIQGYVGNPARVGAIPIIGGGYPYIGYSHQGGPVKRLVDGHESHSSLRVQISVFGPEETRGDLYDCEMRIRSLLSKRIETNEYGRTFTFLRDGDIDMLDPDPIASKRIIRIGSIWLVMAKSL